MPRIGSATGCQVLPLCTMTTSCWSLSIGKPLSIQTQSKTPTPRCYARAMRIEVLLLLLLSTTAYADVAGTYNVELKETASTCDPKPEKFDKGKLSITVKGSTATVTMTIASPATGRMSSTTENLAAV